MHDTDHHMKQSFIQRSIEKIHSSKIQLVSFDIFDTLLCRPTLFPADLFYLMDDGVRDILNYRNIVFSKIRPVLELDARKLHPHLEDITLDEIYEYFSQFYGIPRKKALQIMHLEMKIEEKYLKPRKIGLELYREAKKSRKKIILVSDMYLSLEFIERILRKNNYLVYDKIYLSSQERITKHSGKLFDLVLEEIRLPPSSMLHIGDNQQSDIQIPKAKGMKTIHVPKASVVFLYKQRSLWNNLEIHQLESPLRICLGLVANKFFDDPDEQRNYQAIFHGDAYIIGYYALGILLFSLAKWLLENTTLQKHDKIFFLLRDGFMPQKAYNLLQKHYPRSSPSEEMFSSRRLLSPLQNLYPHDFITSTFEFINAKVTIASFITQRLGEGFLADYKKKIIETIGPLDRKASSCREELRKFFLDFREEIENSLQKSRKIISKYYNKRIKGCQNIALYDVGFCSSFQHILTPIYQNIHGYYIHADYERMIDLGRTYLSQQVFSGKQNSRLNNLRRVKPEENSTNIFYELFFSSLSPSCIGLTSDQEAKRIKPIFSETEFSSHAKKTINKIQKGMLDFVCELESLFEDDIKKLHLTYDTSLHVIHTFIVQPKRIDAKILQKMVFKDEQNLGPKASYSFLSLWPQGYRAIYPLKYSVISHLRSHVAFHKKLKLFCEQHSLLKKGILSTFYLKFIYPTSWFLYKKFTRKFYA